MTQPDPPPGPAPAPGASGTPAYARPAPPHDREEAWQEEAGQEQAWQRLAPAMAVAGPLRTLRGFAIPILVAMVGIGSSDAGMSLRILPALLVAALLVGLVPWLTTRWRVTGTHVQVRRGLVSRTMLTAPLDRVRSVDLEATLLHRALGMTVVKVGTGVDDTRIELDALRVAQATDLQRWLLERRSQGEAAGPAEARGEGHPWERDRPTSAAPAAEPGPGTHATPPSEPELLARIDWSWLRFAPLSLGRLVVVVGFVGLISQLFNDVPVLDGEDVRSAGRLLLDLGVVVLVGVGLLLAVVGWLAISVIGYVLQWWDLRLVLADGRLRLTAGLFTTRSTTVEEARVRGVRVTEPVLMRPAGGAELHALATGVGSGGMTKLLPPSPVGVDLAVGARVLGAADSEPGPGQPGPGVTPGGGPLTVPLVDHGPVARRRCYLRALRRALLPSGALVATAVVLDVAGWWLAPVLLALLLGAAASAELSWRHLGHALTDEHLVVGAPSATRTRTALERDGVIGWNVSESWLQRRGGLVTLVATTAAGPERVSVVDVPRQAALRLADRATPGMREDLLATAAAVAPDPPGDPSPP